MYIRVYIHISISIRISTSMSIYIHINLGTLCTGSADKRPFRLQQRRRVQRGGQGEKPGCDSSSMEGFSHRLQAATYLPLPIGWTHGDRRGVGWRIRWGREWGVLPAVVRAAQQADARGVPRGDNPRAPMLGDTGTSGVPTTGRNGASTHVQGIYI